MVTELNSENFEQEVLKSDIPVLVDFFASWCGPCQMMGPVFEQVSKEFEGKVKFAKLSTEDEPGLAGQYGVQSIPCFIMFKDGKESDRIIGASPNDAFKMKVNSLL